MSRSIKEREARPPDSNKLATLKQLEFQGTLEIVLGPQVKIDGDSEGAVDSKH